MASITITFQRPRSRSWPQWTHFCHFPRCTYSNTLYINDIRPFLYYVLLTRFMNRPKKKNQHLVMNYEYLSIFHHTKIKGKIVYVTLLLYRYVNCTTYFQETIFWRKTPKYKEPKANEWFECDFCYPKCGASAYFWNEKGF